MVPLRGSQPYSILDCCDLHLAALTFTIVFVTTMVLVTASTRSGRASRFLMVRRIGCAVCRQPEPVGLGSTRRMPNHLRKIRTCHGLEDRLRGITPQTPGGPHTPTRTSPLSHADHPRHTLLGSWDDGSVPVTTPAGPKTRAIADQNTTVESTTRVLILHGGGKSTHENSNSSFHVFTNS